MSNTALPVPLAASRPTRRRFLQWVSGVAAAITGFVVGVPVIRSFISPSLVKPTGSTWIKVADDIALIDLDVPVRYDFLQTVEDAWVESRTQNAVWLFTEDGETFKAFNGHCTHLGCEFGFDPGRKVFLCPCHRGQFDVKTGAVLAGPPPRPLDQLPVEIRDSEVWVNYQDFRLGVPRKIAV
ncbi:MAG: ubiquinol-cytochrome c reductase iron-sulfur subunit [Gemmatimonadales bacterium]